MFIVIEGPDQVGKTEQARLLAEWLRSLGREVDSYSFPTRDAPTSQVIRDWLSRQFAVFYAEAPEDVARDLAVTFQCLQLVDKYAAVPAVVRSLRAGRDVVCCRWWQSSYAYGLDEGLPAEWVTDTCHLLPRADVNFLLDLDPAVAASRGNRIVLDRYDLDLGKQERVRVYSVLWQEARRGRETPGRWEVVDGSGTPEEVHGRVKSIVIQETKDD